MRHTDRVTARRRLDQRLRLVDAEDAFACPAGGWIKAIREALGMTAAQLAVRLGVTQSRVSVMEKAELRGSLTLDSLERAAQALDCRLVYVLVPRKPLSELVAERSLIVARRRLQSASHNMVLEAQGVDPEEGEAQVQALAQQLATTAGSALWEDK
ncbi:MAG: mobile mystery protein A [Xanthomonadaceae bacterium]|nr:mobile mystery protein A [Xanthomonadaceae bacterium]